MGALTKIRQSGFEVSFVDGFIEISPFSKLTPPQLDYLKSHKPEIIAELKAANDNGIQPLEDWQTQAITAWVHSLGGKPETLLEDTADVLTQCRRDPEALAYFLKRAKEVKPPLSQTILVTCSDCQNFRPHHKHGKGSGDCAVNVKPVGITHWYDTPKTCSQFQTKEETQK
jgi:hypothetical protein